MVLVQKNVRTPYLVKLYAVFTKVLKVIGGGAKMTIGEQLTTARKARKLTQQQVAEQLHVTRQTISSWEVGRSYPDLASV